MPPCHHSAYLREHLELRRGVPARRDHELRVRHARPAVLVVEVVHLRAPHGVLDELHRVLAHVRRHGPVAEHRILDLVAALLRRALLLLEALPVDVLAAHAGLAADHRCLKKMRKTPAFYRCSHLFTWFRDKYRAIGQPKQDKSRRIRKEYFSEKKYKFSHR